MTINHTDAIFRHLSRKKYIEAMEETEYGWKATERFPHICCPSDLEFISVKEEPFNGECHSTCEECWKYVLKNKNW